MDDRLIGVMTIVAIVTTAAMQAAGRVKPDAIIAQIPAPAEVADRETVARMTVVLMRLAVNALAPVAHRVSGMMEPTTSIETVAAGAIEASAIES